MLLLGPIRHHGSMKEHQWDHNSPHLLGLELHYLHPWVLTSDLFPAPDSSVLAASCLSRLRVAETVRVTASSSIPQQFCPVGNRRDSIIVLSFLLCDHVKTPRIFQKHCSPNSKILPLAHWCFQAELNNYCRYFKRKTKSCRTATTTRYCHILVWHPHSGTTRLSQSPSSIRSNRPH